MLTVATWTAGLIASKSSGLRSLANVVSPSGSSAFGFRTPQTNGMIKSSSITPYLFRALGNACSRPGQAEPSGLLTSVQSHMSQCSEMVRRNCWSEFEAAWLIIGLCLGHNPGAGDKREVKHAHVRVHGASLFIFERKRWIWLLPRIRLETILHRRLVDRMFPGRQCTRST